MKSKLIVAVMIFVCFLLQCTVLQAVAIGSIVPNLLVILCVSIGLLRGKKAGMFTGFFCGLLADLFYGSLFGFYALLFMYLGYFSGFAFNVYYDDDVKVPMMLAAGGDLVYGIAVYALQFLLRGRLGFFTYLYRIMIPEIIYTVILTLLVYRIFYKVNYRFMPIAAKERDSYWVLK